MLEPYAAGIGPPLDGFGPHALPHSRSISLLDNDAKIFGMSFAKLLKLGLNDIIDKEHIQ